MSVYKYFTDEGHARAFLRHGAMLLRPLSHFRNLEADGVRGDGGDGVLTYAPAGGLQVTKSDGTEVVLADTAFVASARCGDIFIWCASDRLSEEIAAGFRSPFCVEVLDPDVLVGRLRARASPKSRLDYAGALGQSVTYHPRERPPIVDWALPDRVAFNKPASFAWQNEFRIAVGRWGAFDVENVVCSLVEGNAAPDGRGDAGDDGFVIRVGGLGDMARLHTF